MKELVLVGDVPKRVLMSGLSRQQREELQEQIAEFCATPKTHLEVAEQFNLADISASNVLSQMCPSLLVYDGERYVKKAE